MPIDYIMKYFPVERIGFKKLEQSSLIFSAAGLQSDRGQVFCRKNARKSSLDILILRFIQGFLKEALRSR